MGVRWSQAELEAEIRKHNRIIVDAVATDTTSVVVPPKGNSNKYHAKRVNVDNIWFDSKREAARYGELKLMLKAGLISDLKIHPVREISADNWTHICNVELDFAYKNKNGWWVFEDVKSSATDTPLSRLKRKLVEVFYSIKVEIIK